MTSARSALLLAGLMASAGFAHFAAPRQFDSIVPRSLPGSPRAWTKAGGVAELALAAGLALPATRRASALFFAGVFPANVKMAYDWRHRSPRPPHHRPPPGLPAPLDLHLPRPPPLR
ncbi:hypothetical protein ACFWGM_19790, partial [Streptomyces roseolus]|uniref:hypothetical protein n=1 Tax=Streptomyces roseolus TaxID=67358 RepID=UPI003658A2B3